MLWLALVSVLAQTGPKCVTTGGTRTCGYECVENGSTAACAQTPQGVCTKNVSGVTCFDPPLWLSALNLGGLPKPTCVTDGGNLACGYDCKREGGRVACAQTPKGLCTIAYGKVTCVDPPAVAYAVFGADVPAPSCKQQDGLIACGYQCSSGNGQVQCAKSPFGVCAENGTAPTCFDPSSAVMCAKGKATPRPQCVTASGRVVCGYNCKVAGAEVACAQTPDGTCDTNGPGKPTCFDPPVRGGSAACLEASAGR